MTVTRTPTRALPAVVLHLLYGTLAGGAFGGLVGTSEHRRRERSLHLWTGLGAVYGLVLSELGLHVLLERVNDQDVPPDERFLFHLGHLVYGLTLGAWCGYRDRDRDRQ
ncbi:hypothetical protein ACFQE1_10920 [Halobium palmae]|uniref:Uncharacterized protein n=1 Tax=Halobium palmae TaxID=1776492 RepID=A0ABD5S143_9EURY